MKIQLLLLLLIVSIQSMKSQIFSDTFNTQTQNDPFQTFIVPCGVTSITINAVGASGGGINSEPISTCSNCFPGLGARMIGTFSVVPGQVLRIRAGRHGISAAGVTTNFYGGSGGGASWVYNSTTSQVLVVAGGGGGTTRSLTDASIHIKGGNATITNSGTSGGNSTGLSAGGGGGGWITNGAGIGGGKSYTNGGTGGGVSGNPSFNYGGFGGGGGGSGYSTGGGGGGGGYSGGNGGYLSSNTPPAPPYVFASTGGGSYNAGTNQQNLVSQKGPIPPNYTSQYTAYWNGQVIISYLSPLSSPNIVGQSLICSGSNTTLSIQNPISGCNYVWSNGATGTSIQVSSAGSYTVYGTSSCGTSTTSNTFSVTVNQSPSVSFNNNGALTFCQGDSVELIANGTAGVSYQWKKDNLDIIGATNSNYIAQIAGSYSVVVTSTNGCSTTSNPSNVVVYQLPFIAISSTDLLEYCMGEMILSDLTVSQNQSYQWNTGETTQSITANQAGTYSVLVIDANGCQNSDSVQIVVNPLPNVTAGNDQITCQGQSVTFNATGGTTYSWNNGVTNNTAFTPTATNNYVVVGTDANGCQDSDTVNVKVNQNTTSTINQTANNTYTLNGQIYTQSGTYTQVIPNTNGCDSTITLNLTINNIGLDEVINSAISIYPNPSSNQITITYAGQIQKVEILDAKGATVYSSIENKKEIVLASNMQSGYYLVLVHTAEGVFRKELVVNK